jgi:hypothetical protein
VPVGLNHWISADLALLNAPGSHFGMGKIAIAVVLLP